MKDQLKQVFLRSWSPAEKGLLLVDVLLSGVLLGWLTWPCRKAAAGDMAKFFVKAVDENDEDDYENDDDSNGNAIEIEIEKQ